MRLAANKVTLTWRLHHRLPTDMDTTMVMGTIADMVEEKVNMDTALMVAMKLNPMEDMVTEDTSRVAG